MNRYSFERYEMLCLYVMVDVLCECCPVIINYHANSDIAFTAFVANVL